MCVSVLANNNHEGMEATLAPLLFSKAASCSSLSALLANEDAQKPTADDTEATATTSCSSSISAINDTDDSLLLVGGKRRKTSKLSSPGSSGHLFDIASLMDAIHQEVERDDAAAPAVASEDDDDFTFIDIFADDTEVDDDDKVLEFPVLPFSSRNTAISNTSSDSDDDEQDKREPLRRPSFLGKRSRGLIRSQTVSTNLCMLG